MPLSAAIHCEQEEPWVMKLARCDVQTIHKIGQWSSNIFLTCIHKQMASLSSNIATWDPGNQHSSAMAFPWCHMVAMCVAISGLNNWAMKVKIKGCVFGAWAEAEMWLNSFRDWIAQRKQAQVTWVGSPTSQWSKDKKGTNKGTGLFVKGPATSVKWVDGSQNKIGQWMDNLDPVDQHLSDSIFLLCKNVCCIGKAVQTLLKRWGSNQLKIWIWEPTAPWDLVIQQHLHCKLFPCSGGIKLFTCPAFWELKLQSWF